MTGPVTEVALAHDLEPPPGSASAVAKLEWTCRKLGLPQPVYKVQDHKPKGRQRNYDCTVKVNILINNNIHCNLLFAFSLEWCTTQRPFDTFCLDENGRIKQRTSHVV